MRNGGECALRARYGKDLSKRIGSLSVVRRRNWRSRARRFRAVRRFPSLLGRFPRREAGKWLSRSGRGWQMRDGEDRREHDKTRSAIPPPSPHDPSPFQRGRMNSLLRLSSLIRVWIFALSRLGRLKDARARQALVLITGRINQSAIIPIHGAAPFMPYFSSIGDEGIRRIGRDAMVGWICEIWRIGKSQGDGERVAVGMDLVSVRVKHFC